MQHRVRSMFHCKIYHRKNSLEPPYIGISIINKLLGPLYIYNKNAYTGKTVHLHWNGIKDLWLWMRFSFQLQNGFTTGEILPTYVDIICDGNTWYTKTYCYYPEPTMTLSFGNLEKPYLIEAGICDIVNTSQTKTTCNIDRTNEPCHRLISRDCEGFTQILNNRKVVSDTADRENLSIDKVSYLHMIHLRIS